MTALPPGTLMQRAAAGLAAAVVGVLRDRGSRAYGARVVLLVGSGSNGGDALFAGARLARRGAHVVAVLAGERAHPAGVQALLDAGSRQCSGVTDSAAQAMQALAGADVVVDGLLGIGGRPGLDDVTTRLLHALPAGVPVVAVDLPSGVEPGTGECGAAGSAVVDADLTVTFGVAKPALLLPPGGRRAGRLQVLDIGLPTAGLGADVVQRLERADLARLWPRPRPDDDKYRRGVVGVVAGGAGYTGAAVLSVGAAVRSGAGMVRYVGPDEPAALVRAWWPQAVLGGGRVQSWVLGPGVDPDQDASQRAAMTRALGCDLPCVVDAGALALVAARSAPTLLTPHAGELAALLNRLDVRATGAQVQRADVEAAPLRHARRAVELTGATVLLKGATTIVVPPQGPVLSQADGPAWLAAAGSGDVLAGLAGALLAAGLGPALAGAVAAAVHGRAGSRASGGGPVDAVRVLEAIPATIAALLR